jgi:hypothetical protein
VRAKTTILQNVELGYYAGVLRPGCFADDNNYVFGIANHGNNLDMVIDAKEKGNILRFVNDPRKTGLEPNVQCVEDIIEVKGQKIPAVLFVAAATIHAGEELLFPYEAGVRGYWGPPNVEVVDLTGDGVNIIKRERSDGNAQSIKMKMLNSIYRFSQLMWSLFSMQTNMGRCGV